jgi:hypothetical protein
MFKEVLTMHTHNVRIYSADTALRDEDAVIANRAASLAVPQSKSPIHEASLAHFCAFVDLYTRKTADPMSTSLACEKQAEAVELGPEDATPENLRMLMDTMLEAIDHLEKKWLDEQIRHEDRQRQHREDVARLYQRLRELQPQPRNRLHLYEKGAQWIHNLLFRRNSNSIKPSSRARKPILPKRVHDSTGVVRA